VGENWLILVNAVLKKKGKTYENTESESGTRMGTYFGLQWSLNKISTVTRGPVMKGRYWCPLYHAVYTGYIRAETKIRIFKLTKKEKKMKGKERMERGKMGK